MRIRLLPEAERDLEIGADFYESQQAGLGTYFNDCLLSDIESLKLYAGIHEQYLGFFRSLSKRFPFSIYCKLNADTAGLSLAESPLAVAFLPTMRLEATRLRRASA